MLFRSTSAPSFVPSAIPSFTPSFDPSTAPSSAPSVFPSSSPSYVLTLPPTTVSSLILQASPMINPSVTPMWIFMMVMTSPPSCPLMFSNMLEIFWKWSPWVLHQQPFLGTSLLIPHILSIRRTCWKHDHLVPALGMITFLHNSLFIYPPIQLNFQLLWTQELVSQSLLFEVILYLNCQDQHNLP